MVEGGGIMVESGPGGTYREHDPHERTCGLGSGQRAEGPALRREAGPGVHARVPSLSVHEELDAGRDVTHVAAAEDGYSAPVPGHFPRHTFARSSCHHFPPATSTAAQSAAVGGWSGASLARIVG
jgi:hypothetical protein